MEIEEQCEGWKVIIDLDATGKMTISNQGFTAMELLGLFRIAEAHILTQDIKEG